MRLPLTELVEAERLTGSDKWAMPETRANLIVVRPVSESTTYGEAHLTSYARGTHGAGAQHRKNMRRK